MPLSEIRKRIDALDAEIVRLLDKRAKAGREAADAKKERGLPLRNPEREREVLERLVALSNGSMPAPRLQRIYRTIIDETLGLEEDDATFCPGPAGKQDVAAKILENVEIAPGFYRMRLRTPELVGAFQPGQFFQLRIDAAAEFPFLRRPFAPCAYEPDGFSFVYAVVGDGTKRMSLLTRGDEVGVLAPLGNAFTLLPGGTSALLLGGGCGAPSLAPLAKRLQSGMVRTTVVIGARSACALIGDDSCADCCDRLIVATDDGSKGCRGNVIEAYRQEAGNLPKIDRIYACGPIPMLRGAAALAEELGVDCEVSLEERMACGFGACVGCAVPVIDEKAADGFAYRKVCHDGPVFNAGVLAWDRMR